jgi:hypothetical protein
MFTSMDEILPMGVFVTQDAGGTGGRQTLSLVVKCPQRISAFPEGGAAGAPGLLEDLGPCQPPAVPDSWLQEKGLLIKEKNSIRSPGSGADNQKQLLAGHQWLTPVILATQEAEIRRIEVQSQPGQIV